VSSNEIEATPDTETSAALTEKVAREPAKADNPIFLNCSY